MDVMSYWIVWPAGIVLWLIIGWAAFAYFEAKAMRHDARKDQITLSMFIICALSFVFQVCRWNIFENFFQSFSSRQRSFPFSLFWSFKCASVGLRWHFGASQVCR